MKLQWSEELGTIVEEQNLLSEAVQPTNQLLTEFTQNNPFSSQLKTTIVEEGNLTETNTDDDGEDSLVTPANRSKVEDTVNLSDSREDNVQLTSAQPAEIAQANEVALNIDNFQFIEGDSGKTTDFIFAANLDQAPSQPVTVDFRTVDGSATAGEDYIATSGTLTFEAGLEGLLVETIEVEVLGDNIEENNETFRVELSNPSNNLTLNNSTVTGTIIDDESFEPPQNEPEGPVTSQGDQALKADEARSNFNVDGSGITVGVLSDSYNNLNGAAEGVANGDLPGPENPANTTPVEVLEEPRSGGSDEGRAMMELIHDIAPGANLVFHTASGGRDNFAEGINDLVEAGADIIVDDIGYRTQPFFQDGLVAQEAQEAVSQGIPFFSAAGNNGNQSYESEFRVGEELPQISSNYVFHDFDPSSEVDSLQQFTLEEGEQIDLSFQWDEPFASVGPTGSSSDLDIFLLNDSGDNLVTQSIDLNVGSDPVELLNFQNTTSESQTYNLAIGRFEPEGGSNPGLIKYINFGDEMENLEFDTDSSTIFGHPNAEGVAGVGATSFQNTPEFGTNPPQVESFSSKGGTPILFDREGNRLSEPEIRDQPRFTAPDKTNTSFFPENNDLVADSDNFPNFPGTSAAAPHAAAVGALMLEATGGPGSVTPEQIYQTLENTAIDIGEEGFNFKSGSGLIQANQAVEEIINQDSEPPIASADSFTTNEGTTFTTGNVLDNDSDPENDSLFITEVNTTETLGTVTNNEDGTFEYNPNGQFENLSQGETATDTFDYIVGDGNGNTDTATVTITIEGINNEENSSSGEVQANKLILTGSDQQLTIPFNAEIQGTSAEETVLIQDNTTVSFNAQSRDRVDVAQSLTDYTIEQTGLTELTLTENNGGDTITLTVNQNQAFDLQFANGDATVNLNNNGEISVGNELLGVNEKADIGNINLGNDNSALPDNFQSSLNSEQANLQNQLNVANFSEEKDINLSEEAIFPTETSPKLIDDSDLGNDNDNGALALNNEIGNDLILA